MNIYLGIDPGLSGGIALLSSHEVTAFKMPTDIAALKHLINEIAIWHMPNVKAFIEKVHSFPGQGVSSTFKFGVNFGALQGVLTAYDIPFELVAPGVWQKALGCLTKGNKNVTKELAGRLFPKIKVIHATADALLIAEYGRRKYERA